MGLEPRRSLPTCLLWSGNRDKHPRKTESSLLSACWRSRSSELGLNRLAGHFPQRRVAEARWAFFPTRFPTQHALPRPDWLAAHAHQQTALSAIIQSKRKRRDATCQSDCRRRDALSQPERRKRNTASQSETGRGEASGQYQRRGRDGISQPERKRRDAINQSARRRACCVGKRVG